MSLVEKQYAVILYGHRVGLLAQRGDHVRFTFQEGYRENPDRPVLGLRFEDHPVGAYGAALRLPPWFSNLLPEGALRRWIAEAGHVSADREMELLAKIGHDLPGAVQVVPAAAVEPDGTWEVESPPHPSGDDVTEPWRFSLAGVAMKLSMLQRGDRLTVPAYGERGDWIVKLPDQAFPAVPQNEYAMMRFAAEVGIQVPEVRLVHRDDLPGVPSRMWPSGEHVAYAIKRFDRAEDGHRTPIHIEDFAQVLDRYADRKYEGNYETAAALVYRGHDVTALREFVRRLTFSVLIGNGDAHLKNWSLIYPDRISPTLAPAYDLVSTFLYREAGDGPEDLALKLCGTRRFDMVTPGAFERLERRLDERFGTTGGQLAEVVADTVRRARRALPGAVAQLEPESASHASALNDWFAAHARQLTTARRD
ncbi:serine/threonine-protein kinase HipA [Stackebrandtia albiflava]|uniref:Serine/threonine-protein kinase HipA n=1 Tax=Stackebrandtia albiflava TaxID=406432 RepID=A0A562V375_9ACTN|nr:type II toxin-antitoxin system HipA family toxin [Stackebrandtia albiflava]TWJ12346.1 serine/threonine-protein kinase HipA [Stackebrandtia albiflava]